MVRFDAAADRYLIGTPAEIAAGNAPESIDLADAPYQAEIVSAVFGGLGDAAFDGGGVPASGGIVQVRSGTEVWRVTMDDVGNITVARVAPQVIALEPGGPQLKGVD